MQRCLDHLLRHNNVHPGCFTCELFDMWKIIMENCLKVVKGIAMYRPSAFAGLVWSSEVNCSF